MIGRSVNVGIVPPLVVAGERIDFAVISGVISVEARLTMPDDYGYGEHARTLSRFRDFLSRRRREVAGRGEVQRG